MLDNVCKVKYLLFNYFSWKGYIYRVFCCTHSIKLPLSAKQQLNVNPLKKYFTVGAIPTATTPKKEIKLVIVWLMGALNFNDGFRCDPQHLCIRHQIFLTTASISPS